MSAISTALAAPALAVAALALIALALLLVLFVSITLIVQSSSTRPRDHAVYLSRQPYWVFVLLSRMLYWASLFSRLKPAPLRVAEVAVSCIHSQVLFVLVNLGVAEALKDGPKTAAQLAAAAGPNTNAEWLARVLKLAAELGLVKRTRRPGRSLAAVVSSTAKQLTPSTTQKVDVTADATSPDATAADATAVDAASSKDTQAPTRQPFSTGYSCNDLYSANAVTAVLCRDHPNCMADFVKLMEDHYAPLGYTSQGISTNQIPMKLWTGGLDFWEHLRASPRHAATFDGAMRATNHIGAKMAVEQYPWNKYNVVVDIGGGNGQFLAALLSKHPQLRGVLVDQQAQVERGQQWWAKEFAALLPRVEFVVGDMFQPSTLPCPRPGLKTCYVLKQILHDWSDTDSLAILAAIRAAIAQEDINAGRASLVVLETGTAENLNRAILQHRLEADVVMLKSFGDGKERDEHQTRVLLEAAGFSPGRLLPTTGLMTIQEAVPVREPEATA